MTDNRFTVAQAMRAVRRDIAAAEPADTNNPMATAFTAFVIGKELEAFGKQVAKNADAAIRAEHADLLATPGAVETLFENADVRVDVKVENPRANFDKAMFIKAVAARTGMSIADLTAMAANSTKETKPVVKFTTSVKGGINA
jgi:hypothetical protein